MTFLRRWWFLGVALVGLATWAARLESEVGRKADATSVTSIQRDLVEIKMKLDDMDTRQRQFFCRDQPVWCR